MSLILNGNKILTDDTKNLNELGLNKIVNWQDNPHLLTEVTDKNDRSKQVRLICAHTHIGNLGSVKPGHGSNTTLAERLARYQVTTNRYVSWDATIDSSGRILVQNDPLKHFTWHATSINPISMGFELVQENNGDLYEEQLNQAVLYIDLMTALLGIQRQIFWDKQKDKPVLTQIPRLESGGNDVVGIIGHVQQTKNRGAGDPGPHLFYKLKDAGYELIEYRTNEDLELWKYRQRMLLGFTDPNVDGVPLKRTRDRIKQMYTNKIFGLWVERPMDQKLMNMLKQENFVLP